MSRERSAAVPAMSLFPFIAVLLCTMGALLVLLVMFSRAASEDPLATDEPVPGTQTAENAGLDMGQEPVEQLPDVEELERLRAAVLERVANAESTKREAEEQLRTARLRLAGIEENARELKAELDRHVDVIRGLKESRPSTPDDVEQLGRMLAAEEESLESIKKSAEGKPAAYAVVPYVGPSGTRRRPLYIECSFDGVFLQPEGVRLTPSDFEGPPGPGNPLASALRAAREYLVTNSQGALAEGDQPYPLLLVRPSGVMAYYAARESLSSWGSDFGYQLIDEDWTLAFPPADPALADVEQEAVIEARARLQWLAQRRGKVETKPKTTYRAATTRGGVVEAGAASLMGDPERFEWRERTDAAAAAGGQVGGRPTTASAGSPGVSGFGQRSPTANGRGEKGLGLGGPASGGAGPSTPGSGSEASSVGSPASLAVTGPMGGSGDRIERGASSDRQTGRPGGDGGSVKGLEGSGGLADTGAVGSGGGQLPQQPGVAGGTQAGSISTGSPQAAGMAGNAAGSSGSAASGSLSVPLSGVRGANWASLATRDRPIPLTRPIMVECAADEFRIYDDSRRRIVQRVPIKDATEAAVDPLVRHVQDRVAGWGIAGERMYWRPQLVLTETIDGSARRQDLERLLEGSGLDTQVRSPEVAPLPAVRSPASAVRAVSRAGRSSNELSPPAIRPDTESHRQHASLVEVGG